MADILVMEPVHQVNRLIVTTLRTAGYHCLPCTTLTQGLERLQGSNRMITILNAGLPWRESKAFLEALQAQGLPVLFITENPGNEAHLKALYQSDCHVLLSPFTGNELLAALHQLMAQAPSVLTLGEVSLDMNSKTVTVKGRPMSLTAQEFALLHAFMRQPEATLSREELLRTAWGYQSLGITRTVDVHVQRLRRKMGAAYIETIYKMGYRLNPAC